MLDSAHLNELFDILKGIHTLHEAEQLWRFVLNRCCQTLQAEAGSFFVVVAEERMELAAAVGVDEERLRRVPLRVGAGVCGWVAQNQQAALIADAPSDSRFNPIADQITGIRTRSLLCIPIFFQSKTYGVIELVNSRHRSFNAEDQEFMTVLGQQTAIAYQNLLLSHETSQTKVLLESLLLNMSGGLIAVDSQRHLTILNPSARNLLALPEAVTIGKPAVAVLMDYPALLAVLHKTFVEGKTLSRQETNLTIRGVSTLFGYSTILITNPEQQILGAGVIFQKLV